MSGSKKRGPFISKMHYTAQSKIPPTEAAAPMEQCILKFPYPRASLHCPNGLPWIGAKESKRETRDREWVRGLQCAGAAEIPFYLHLSSQKSPHFSPCLPCSTNPTPLPIPTAEESQQQWPWISGTLAIRGSGLEMV